MPQSVRPEVLRDLIEAATTSQVALDAAQSASKEADKSLVMAQQTHDRAIKELENAIPLQSVIVHGGAMYMIRAGFGIGGPRIVSVPSVTTEDVSAAAVYTTATTTRMGDSKGEVVKPIVGNTPAPPVAAKPVVTPPAPPASAPPANPPKANPVQSQKKP